MRNKDVKMMVEVKRSGGKAIRAPSSQALLRRIGPLAPRVSSGPRTIGIGGDLLVFPLPHTRHAVRTGGSKVDVMREGQSELVRPFRVLTTALRSMPLLHHQRRLLPPPFAHVTLAPSASSSCYMGRTRFHCMSWDARSRSRQPLVELSPDLRRLRQLGVCLPAQNIGRR